MYLYSRYKQIEQYYREHLLSECSRVLCRNRLALAVGTMACLGLSLVANFQETNIFVVHLVGAITCFGCGLLYCWLQTWISFSMCPLVNSRGCARWRFFLCTIMTIAFITELVATPFAFKYYHGDNPRKWKPGDGGYMIHIISAVAEWILALCLDLFIGSFITEMKRISVESPKVLFILENVNVLPVNFPYLTDDSEVYPGSSGSLESSQISNPGSRSNQYNIRIR